MTYFGVLLQFVVVPIMVLLLLTYRDRRLARALPESLRFLSPWWTLGILAVVAVVYTTPWDNYLVATRVWWYDPALVTGVTLGWVPLEEYAFFVLQTVMSGLWLLFLARRLPVNTAFTPRRKLRVGSVAVASLIWLGSLLLLFFGPRSGNYLALELAWALPPIILQLAVGADILWRHRRLVGLAIGSATLYLCAVDALAIGSGTWTINPDQSLGILLGGVLPIEEAIFFLLTNTLLGFGLVLAMARATARRLPSSLLRRLAHRDQKPAAPPPPSIRRPQGFSHE